MTEQHLTTGSEPDLAVQDSLLRQFVFSCADRTTWMAVALGGRSSLDDGQPVYERMRATMWARMAA
jgi:hypothetical protein